MARIELLIVFVLLRWVRTQPIMLMIIAETAHAAIVKLLIRLGHQGQRAHGASD